MKLRRCAVLMLCVCTVFSINLVYAESWGTNSKNQHTVNRLYQLVYGSVDMCRRYSPSEADGVRAESDRFKVAYSELVGVLEASPYFSVAKKTMDEMIIGMEAEATKNPKLASCQESIWTLKESINDTNAKQGLDQLLLELRAGR